MCFDGIQASIAEDTCGPTHAPDSGPSALASALLTHHTGASIHTHLTIQPLRPATMSLVQHRNAGTIDSIVQYLTCHHTTQYQIAPAHSFSSVLLQLAYANHMQQLYAPKNVTIEVYFVSLAYM